MESPPSFWSGLLPPPSVAQRFLAAQRPSPPLPSSPYTFTFLEPNEKEIHETEAFLGQHFAAGNPRLVAPLRPSTTELVLLAAQDGSALVGCIRFKQSGFFEGQPIHLIDAFCVHPAHRKKGLATSLLSVLHTETQARGLPYSVFLKEGRPLPIAQPPLYSSTYLYCRRGDLKKIASASAPPVSLVAAHIRAYQTLRPDTFVYWDPKNPNQTWRLWRVGHDWLLVCVQDAFQEIDGERIGWMTALLESPGFEEDTRRADVLEGLLATTPYSWIWTDRVFVGACPSAVWKADGAFHWYSYGWTTCLRPGANYVLVV
jgi:GNAT superfamily N-acetyltransferase